MKTKNETINKENIRTLVESFYAKILGDAIVAPFFIDALGDDLNSPVWQAHLEKLTAFWAAMTLGEAGYVGQPVKPHMHMEGLEKATFDRWLELFFETVDRLYSQECGRVFKEKSQMIAGNFMRLLGLVR